MIFKHNKIPKKIAIIGGGVAGTTAALYFAKLGLDITLFEKDSSLISGPPFCHLHAGGNLYPEISDTQCLALLRQSIEFLRFYPYIIDYRPTVIILPTMHNNTPEALLPRLKLLAREYKRLIAKDVNNEVLGKAQNYYKLYSKDEIVQLKEKKLTQKPNTFDEWMIAVAKHVDLKKVQFPLIMVQEFGLNLFRLAAGTTLSLQTMNNVTMHMQSIVHDIQKNYDLGRWKISYVQDDASYTQSFDYLINAAGFRTGKIDDLLGIPCERMVEFKAAYVAKCDTYHNIKFPEIIFHGERGTPRGMGQFTPYPQGYFQLHGMTEEITLYKDGLVQNTTLSCQPQLNKNFKEKIEKSWRDEEVLTRTHAAIKHLTQYIPHFAAAKVGSKPLFGAQQIPGDDPTLRVAEVSFPHTHYARCEIVKVSSVLDMCKAIAEDMISCGILEKSAKKEYLIFKNIEEEELHALAEKIALSRGYPKALATRTVSHLTPS